MPYVTNFNGTKQVSVNLHKYAIKWHKKSASQFQKKVKDFLYKYWAADVGVCEEFKIPGKGCRLECDFVNYNEFFHKGNPIELIMSLRRDDAKRKWLEKNGFKVIELIEEDLPQLSPEFIKEKFGVDII
jgi:hypothetical protein